jgi:hypothetical protein
MNQNIGDLVVLGQLKKADSDLSLPHQLRHYFYFTSKGAADKLGATLKAKGFVVEIRLSAHDDKTWLALATHQTVPSLEAIQDLRAGFEGLAAHLGGEYDGWEAAVTRD